MTLGRTSSAIWSKPRLPKRSAHLALIVLGAACACYGIADLSAQSIPGTSNSAPAVQRENGSGETLGRGRFTQGVDVLSDTRGVDFGPYIKQLLQIDAASWHGLQMNGMPSDQEGWTVIRLTISPDGALSAMHLDDSSHDEALNRAAWASITSLGKLPPLPREFSGPDLELRIHFNVSQPVTK